MKNLITIMLFMILISCNKNDDQIENTYRYVSEILKDSFLFNEGSYWIYEDKDHNTIKIILIQVETGFTSVCPKNSCGRYEFFELTYYNENPRSNI
jgi:hypothetical protein